MSPDGSIYEGKTLDDAVRKGLEALGLSRAEAMITVIQEGSSGFLGIGARPFRVRIGARPGGAIREPEDRDERRRGGRDRDRGGRDRDRGGRERGGRDRDRGRGNGRDERRAEGGRGGRPEGRRDERRGEVRREGRDERRPEGRGERRPEGREERRPEGRGERRPEVREERRPEGGREERGSGERREERRGEGRRNERREGRRDEERRGAPRPAREERPAIEEPAPEFEAAGATPTAAGPGDEGDPRRRRRRGRRGGRGRRREGAPMGTAEEAGPAFEAGEDRAPEETVNAGVAPAPEWRDTTTEERFGPEAGPATATAATGSGGAYGPDDAGGMEPADAEGTEPAEEPSVGSGRAFERGRGPRRDRGEWRERRGSEPPPPGGLMSEEALAAEGRRVTEELLKAMGFEAKVTATAAEDRVDVTATVSDDEELLTGRKGETRQALQHLLNRMVNRGGGSHYHLQLEINDFWKHRESELAELARTMAEDALARNAEVVTEYLNAQERRIIHVALRGDTRVKTYAIGSGLIKRLAVAPADHPEGSREDD